MNPILDLDVSNRAYLFDKTSIRLGLPRFYVEKDFWVVFILHYLFQESPYRSSFLFKGGNVPFKML
jgi:predicted nucleotidyltransferase component of viral defense system